MHTLRERHNAKARQSTAGQRKKGKRKASSAAVKGPEYDPNSEIIVPKSEEQKELDRRERLKQEVRLEFRPTTSAYSCLLLEAPYSVGVESKQQEEKEA